MAHKGTVEWFRHIYMNDGFMEMVQAIEDLFNETRDGPNAERMDKFIQGILYGSNNQGVMNEKPPAPNPHDMVDHPELYDFQNKVYTQWVRQKQGLNRLDVELDEFAKV